MEEAMSDLIKLTGKQRIELERLLMRHSDSRLYQRAFALLLLDDGQSVDEIATALRVSRQTVYNWVWRFQQRHQRSSIARLADAERGGRPVRSEERRVGKEGRCEERADE